VDLIVLDMKMPEMDGKDCFDQIFEINPKAQIAILSGYIQDEAARYVLDRGAIKFFQKPLKYQELMKWIADLLKN